MKRLIPKYSMKAVSKNEIETAEHAMLFHDGKSKTTFADTLEMVLNGGYRADHSVLSEKHLEGLSRNGKFIPILQLETPQDLQLAVLGQTDSQVVRAYEAALITNTVQTSE